jgi:Asp-tRNA(Asn)/Glu-tRNA(Gln) amidotransferase C subunit
MDKKLEQMVEDLEKILNLFKKMENSSIEDVDALKKESILIQEELKERYDESNTGKTNSQET